MAARSIDLFAVQMHFTLEDYSSPAAFCRKISRLFEHMDAMRARDASGRPRRPALAVFPEDIGTFLLVAPYFRRVRNVRSISEAVRRIVMRRLPQIVWHRARFQVPALQALFLMTARSTYEIYYRTFSTLAQRHQLPVVAGSVLLPDNRYGATDTFRLEWPNGNVYNVSLTFDARGQVVHAVKKVNLVKGVEDVLHLAAGELAEQQPFEISGVRVGNMICYDGFLRGHDPAFVPVGPRLATLGAEIMTQPAANNERWDERWSHCAAGRPMSAGEAWHAHGLMALMAQLPTVRYGVNPMLNGRFFDLSFEGRSTILGRDAQGRAVVLAEAGGCGDDPSSEEILKIEATLPERDRLHPPGAPQGHGNDLDGRRAGTQA